MPSLGTVNAAWNYDGAGTISVTFDTVVGHDYQFTVTDGAANNIQTLTGDGSRDTLTVAALAGLTAGDMFDAKLDDTTALESCASNNFTYGTPSVNGDGIGGNWTFDGTDTFTVEFIGEAGVQYNLQVNYWDSLGTPREEYGAPFTATGAAETQSLTATNPPLGWFRAGVWLAQDTFTSPLSRMFQGGTAGEGIAGNPEPGPGGGDLPADPPGWFIEHYQHEYVPDPGDPTGSTLIADGSLIQTVRPENLHFVLQLGQFGPGSVDYELSLTALDEDGNPAVTPDWIGPKRTDFLLRREDVTDPIMGGVHTAVGGLDGEEPIDHVPIAGKDWLYYLEGRVWPYDAGDGITTGLSYVDWPTGFRFKVAAAEVGQIVKDILETVRDLSANYPSAPDEFGPKPSYSLGFTVDADSTGFTTNYEISNFDASTIYSLIQTLSLMGNTRGGFDFYMTWDKIFKLVAPEIGNPLSPIFSLEVDAVEFGANMLSVGFTNTGPEATHVLGVGAGTSNQQGGINKHFPRSSAVFRRWDKVADFGNVKNLDTLERLTSLELAFGSNPVHEIAVEVEPADIPNFWTITRPGEYVQVVYDLGFHQINSIQRIVSMDCRVDTEGVETVQLSFNQFYDASDASGISDW